MAFFIEQPAEQLDFKPFIDKQLSLPPQAIEHGVGLDHNPNFNPAVPEPQEYALVFGMVLVAFALLRKLKYEYRF